MRDEFVNYLNAIEMTETLQERVESIYEFYEAILPGEITGIFVTDHINQEGAREFENLWFFSDTFALEAKSFIRKDDFDYSPLREVNYWQVQAKEYDFEEATAESRLTVRFSMGRIAGELKASRENCGYLMQILKDYIVPHGDR